MASQLPSWIEPGVDMVHTSFGTGSVVKIGPYKRAMVVWVEFDGGDVKMLHPEWGATHMRRRESSDPTTPADPSIRRDVCGARQVVVRVDKQQLCREHRKAYRPDD
jgi:hypothetical protein